MNLFICYTPLHILVAQQVIKYSNISNYSFIYLYDTESNKNIHYYNLLQEKSDFSIKVLRTKKVFTDFKNIYKIYKLLRKGESLLDVNIYTSNIKSVHTRVLMLLLNYSSLYTFDDGCANIINSGYYASNDESELYRFFFSLVAPSLIYKNLRNKMKIHYSIFKEKNIYPNTKKIDLFTDLSKRDKNSSLPVKKILLTGPFSEVGITDKKVELELYNYVLKKYGIDEILPHPGEKNKKISLVHYINTHLIAEEYIHNVSKNYNIHIYGFYSTALINIAMNFPNVKVTNLHYVPIFLDSDLEKFDKMGIESELVEIK